MAIKLTNLRTLYQSSFARGYKYVFKFTSRPSAENNFGVTLQSGEIEDSCLSVVLPNAGSQIIETEIGTHTLRLHGKKDTGGVINPEFILSGDYNVYKYFRAWQNAATPDSGDNAQTPSNDLLATIQIIGKNIENITTLNIELTNCWCRNCTEINFSDDANDIIRWSPEIVYEFSRDI